MMRGQRTTLREHLLMEAARMVHQQFAGNRG